MATRSTVLVVLVTRRPPQPTGVAIISTATVDFRDPPARRSIECDEI